MILITFLLSIMSIVAYGQVGKGKVLKSELGLKAGVNMSNISNGQSNLDFSPGMNTGFHFGAVANFHFGYRNEGSPVGTGVFGLQPELMFSMQGFSVNGDRVNFSYLTLPVMAKIYITKSVSIEAGPYFSYLLNAAPSTTVIDRAQIDLDGLAGGLDAGAGIGLGYETEFGLTLGARYNMGLSEMANNLRWKNNVMSVSIGYLF